MTHPEKRLAPELSASDVAVLSVVVTGLLAMVCPTGLQVTWLIILGIVAVLRRHGGGIARTLGQPGARPQGPDGG